MALGNGKMYQFAFERERLKKKKKKGQKSVLCTGVVLQWALGALPGV